MTALLRDRPRLVFAGLAATALLVEAWVVGSAGFAARPGVVGTAVTIDLLVVLPVLWSWLGIRRGGAPAWSLVPVLVACGAAAALLLPAEGEVVLAPLLRLAPLLEAAVLLWLGLRARRVLEACRASSEPDAVARLREGLTAVFGGHPGFRVLADELTTIRYLVRPPEDQLPPGAAVFGYHRTSGWGAVVAALALAVAAEAVAVHALVARWSAGGAWVLTALSAYGLLWLVADWRATRHRPLLLAGGRLWLRAGLRWTAEVPLARVAEVHRVSRWRGDAADAAGAGGAGAAAPEDRLDLPVVGGVDLVLGFDRPVEVHGPFGVRRAVRRVGVAADEPEALLRALEPERSG